MIILRLFQKEILLVIARPTYSEKSFQEMRIKNDNLNKGYSDRKRTVRSEENTYAIRLELDSTPF